MDTVKVNLIDIDIKNIEDQIFLYDILKYRWSKPNINISNNIIPTFEEHLCNLNVGKYKKHYRVNIGDLSIGSVYLDNTNTWGIVIVPKMIKNALKFYGITKTELYKNKQHLSYIIFKNLVYLNPKVTNFYAKINAKNNLSINAFLNAGYQPTQIIFEVKSENGKIIGGNWPEV
jgi:hypothetical protein